MALTFLAAFFLGLIVSSPLAAMMGRAGHTRENYKGKGVPTSVGIAFLLVATPVAFAGGVMGLAPPEAVVWGAFIATSVGLIGLLDDLAGAKAAKGLRGHFRALLFQGILSTGALKAIFGGLIALIAAWPVSEGIVELAVNTMIIALSTNFINLLDLRPGRAAKGYLFGLILLVLTRRAGLTSGEAASSSMLNAYFLAPLTGAFLGYLPLDLSERAMMGDTGSNVLGAMMGYGYSVLASPIVKWVFLSFLILIHLYTERHSLSEAIDRSPVLRFLDRLGRI